MQNIFFSNPSLATSELSAIQQKQNCLLKELSNFIQAGTTFQMNMYDLEKELQRLMNDLAKACLEEIISKHNYGKVENVVNSTGQPLPYQSNKTITYLSIFGEIPIKRACYWIKDHACIFPLDARLNLPERHYSYLLNDWTQGLITDMPFEKAISHIGRILNLSLSKLSQENVAREAGYKFNDFYQQKAPFEESTEGSHLAIEADGKGVRMISSEKPQTSENAEKSVRRGKGEKSCGLRKMAYATADFSFNPNVRTPEEMVGILMKEPDKNSDTSRQKKHKRIAINTTIAASMAGKHAAFDALIERVHKRDPCGKKPIIALMDGDPALEEAMWLRLKAAGMQGRIDVVILDIMHAMEYLWAAGTALYGEKSKERVPWVRSHALDILKGNVGYVIGGLKIIIRKRKLSSTCLAALNRTITYFSNHQHMMQYDQYLGSGYPIATGLIEGTCGSLIKDRADISGSRWSSAGVQAVLNERAIMKNGDWKEFWNYHMETEKNRLYGGFILSE